jgi:hypothetical protein
MNGDLEMICNEFPLCIPFAPSPLPSFSFPLTSLPLSPLSSLQRLIAFWPFLSGRPSLATAITFCPVAPHWPRLRRSPTQSQSPASATTFCPVRPQLGLTIPIPTCCTFAFRIKSKDNQCYYGKKDEDIGNVCSGWNVDNIKAYSSESTSSLTSIKKTEVIEFQFGTYSGTSIGNNFLFGCTSLTAPLTIPDSVTSIGNNFLDGCTSLTAPPTIPDSVTSIGAYFLARCSTLRTPPTIPKSVKSIGGHFLEGCTLLGK